MVISTIKKAKDYVKESIKLLYILPGYQKQLKQYKKCANRKIILIGTPAHGNLGDQAIAVTEKQFIQDYKNDETVVEIPTPLYKTHRRQLKRYSKNDDLIVISGGGWMGDLWVHNEIMIRNIIEDYPMNRILIFPQTLYYTDGADGQLVAQETKAIIQKHKNLYLAVRDAHSYETARKLLGLREDQVLFCPDMVLYGTLAKNSTTVKKKTALICMRQDVEKIVNAAGLEAAVTASGYVPQKVTTVLPHLIKMKDRNKCLEEIIEKCGEAEIMITDRLHAMIFSLLAGTPCYVFNNGTGKVFGVASYLQEGDMPVKMLENVDEIKQETFHLGGKPYELSDTLKRCFQRLGELLRNEE